MALFNKINKKELDRQPHARGLFEVDLGNNEFYKGKIYNGKKDGFGQLFQDGKLLYEGIWIHDTKIDDIPLPDELPQNINIETCQGLKLT